MKLLLGALLILPLAACTSFQGPSQQAYKSKRTVNRGLASISENDIRTLISEQLEVTAKISRFRTQDGGGACESGLYRDLVVEGLRSARTIATAVATYPKLSDFITPDALEAVKADIGETASFNYYMNENSPYYMEEFPEGVISGTRFQGPTPGAMGPLFEMHFKKDGTFTRTDYEHTDQEPWRVRHTGTGTWKVMRSKKNNNRSFAARIIVTYDIPFGKNKGKKKTKSYILEHTSWGAFILVKANKYQGPGGNHGYDDVEGYELGSDECSA